MALTELFSDLKENTILDNIDIEGDVCRVSSEIEVKNYCPECGKELTIRNGKHGEFWSCSGYPDCKYAVGKSKLLENRVFIDLISSYGETPVTMLNVVVPLKVGEHIRVTDGSKIHVAGRLKIYNGKLQLQCNSANDITLENENSYVCKKKEWLNDVKFIEKKDKKIFIPRSKIRIAVISTDDKDQGYNDFVNKIYKQNIDYKAYCISPMNADNIIKEFEKVKKGNFDCIAIVRGGGNYNYSLFEFNNPKLAKAINDVEIPVIVGIGHKDDEFLIDEFSYRKAITPTDAAMQINKMCYSNSSMKMNYEDELNEKECRIKELEDELARVKDSKVFKLFDFFQRFLR